MKMNIARWGNSLGVRIPSELARQLGISEGTVVDVTAEGDHLVLRRATPSYSLAQLLEGMTPAAMHEALDWDDWDEDAGRERVP